MDATLRERATAVIEETHRIGVEIDRRKATGQLENLGELKARLDVACAEAVAIEALLDAELEAV